jgi:predicted nucleotidyltransferase
MNQISKSHLALAERNALRYKNNPNIKAVMVTGSIAKGYGDDSSDIDTIVMYDKPYSKQEYDEIIDEARNTGGDLYHGMPEEGFAVYYYIDGIKCDFGIGPYQETEKMITEMLEKPEVDLIKHLQILGFIDGIVLHGEDWVRKWRDKALSYPPELAVMLVNHHKKFHPEWVIRKMAIERNDILFFYESLIESLGNIFGVLCGLNRMYHPGKLKGAEFYIAKMKIKPENFIQRYHNIFSLEPSGAVTELYALIRETLALIEKYMPEVSTERTRNVLEMKLRK